LFEKISDWMVTHMKFADTVKNGVTTSARCNAQNMLLWASLLISGTLLVVPMKKLEDNKGYWVKKANHWLDGIRGDKLSEEEVEKRDKDVERALACEAKQTWPSLIVGRCIAVATALGLGKMLGSEGSKNLMNWSERTLTGSIQPNKNRAHRYAAIAALETLSCGTTSIALEVASKAFAKRGLVARDPELCTQAVHEDNADIGAPHNNPTGTPACATCREPANDTKETPATLVVPPEQDKLEKFRRKPIAKMTSHVEAVQASKPTGLALAT
jgi:hypothetical protein